MTPEETVAYLNEHLDQRTQRVFVPLDKNLDMRAMLQWRATTDHRWSTPGAGKRGWWLSRVEPGAPTDLFFMLFVCFIVKWLLY